MTHNSNNKRPTRGTATVEMLLVIPLLGSIFALIFFMGYASVNQQGVWMSDRYAAWSHLKGSGASSTMVNSTFMNDKGTGVGISYDAAGGKTIQEYVDAVGTMSAPAQTLADRTASQQVNGFSHGVSAHVQAEFPSSVGLWQRFNGPIQSSHAREGRNWRRHEARQLQALVEQFFGEFDSAVPADQMGQRLRLLYTREW